MVTLPWPAGSAGCSTGISLLPHVNDGARPRHRHGPGKLRRYSAVNYAAMRRKLISLAAGASAVLCAAVVLLWIRSEVLQGPKYLELTEATDATSTRIKESEGLQ